MRLLEGAERLAVLHHLEVRAPHLVEYPPRVVLALRQRLGLGLGLGSGLALRVVLALRQRLEGGDGLLALVLTLTPALPLAVTLTRALPLAVTLTLPLTWKVVTASWHLNWQSSR